MPFDSVFQLRNQPVGIVSNPLLIAEIACAHEGDESICRQLIDAACEADCDAIQLQIFRADQQVQLNHPLRPLLDKLELDDNQWDRLFDQARSTGKIVSAFVYDEPSLELALRFLPDLLKLNSSDLNNRPMLQKAGQSQIPISLGTGASKLEEIQWGLEILEQAAARRVILMHGVQDFPTQLPDSRITRINLFRKFWELPIGYADHTDGADPLAQCIDLVALGQGASVIEKHITMDRSKKLTDYQASLEPDTWKSFAQRIRSAAASLRESRPIGLTESDLRYRKFQKKYAFALKDISAGQTLSLDDFVFLRSEREGLQYAQIESIVGSAAPGALGNQTLVPTSWLSAIE